MQRQPACGDDESGCDTSTFPIEIPPQLRPAQHGLPVELETEVHPKVRNHGEGPY